MTTLAPFPIQPELTQIALAYKNPAYISDLILPRSIVGVQTFKYLKHTKQESFTIPDTTVGRKGRPNEVEFTATEESASTVDHALDTGIPNADIENAPANYNPLGRNTEMLSELIALDRELRVSQFVMDAGNYSSSNKSTLSGTSQWSDYTNSDPVYAILTALDSCFVRPQFAALGQQVFTVLRQHPKVVKATNKNSGDSGVAARKAIAELLELEDIYVGQGRYNSAKPGQTPTYGRLWGKDALFFYKNPVAEVNIGVTFGLTAQWGGRIASSWDDKYVGARGGKKVRVGESVKELILAADCAYLFKAAVE